MRKHFIFLLIISMLASCEPQPKVCVDFDNVLEAGTTLYLETCSENTDFHTWEFSDERGYVSDVVERQFQDETEMWVNLTAYSNGAYRSDEVFFSYKTSYRYIDRIEIVGTSTFSKLRVNFDGTNYTSAGAEGTFTDSSPFLITVWPDNVQIIEGKKSSVDLFGIKNSNVISLGGNDFNFATYKENPISFSSDADLIVNVYWRFKY